MPVPLSNDLRKHIIDAKLKDIPETRIAADKAVYKGTIIKLLAFYRTTV